jgi:hypothetical protein
MSVEAFQLSPVTEAGLQHIGNNEPKAAGFETFIDLGTTTTFKLGEKVTERVGIDLKSPARVFAIEYTHGGFAETEHGRLNGLGKYTLLYAPRQEERGLATAGAILSWSETHKLPIASVLHKNPVSALQTLHGLVRGIRLERLTNSRTPKYLPPSRNGHLSQFVTHGYAFTDDDLPPQEGPRIRILDPQYTGSKPFDQINKAQQKTFLTLQLAHEARPDHLWTRAELANLAVEAGLLDPDNPWDINASLQRVMPRHYPHAIERVENTYAITASFQETAADLIERIKMLDTSAQKRQEYVDIAHDICHDQHTIYRIVSRAIQYRKSRTPKQ